MKTTKTLRVLYTFAFVVLLSTNFGCAAFFDAEFGTKPIPTKSDGTPDFDKIEQLMLEDFRKDYLNGGIKSSDFYAPSFVDASAGIGLDLAEDNTDFSYCLGGAYNFRISEDNYNSATYINGFANHQSSSGDDDKFNLTRLGAGVTFFDRASDNGKLDLTYALSGSYGLGSREIFNVKDDLTEIKFGFDFGVNYELTPKIDLALTIPVATWAQQTYESPVGFEIEQQHTWIGFNKDNMVMAHARFKLD